MGKYLLRRILQLIPTLFGIYTVAFFLTRVLPGNPAQFLLGFRGSKSAMAALRATMNLDDPLLTQYIAFLGRMVRGDLGNSYITGQPVSQMLGNAIPLTLQLAVAATIIAVVVGIPLGMVAALQKDRLADNFARMLAVLGTSIPTFWLGIQLQVLFGLQFKLLPVSGTGVDEHLILPSLTLAVTTIAL